MCHFVLSLFVHLFFFCCLRKAEIVASFLWNHWAYFGYTENQIPLKSGLERVSSLTNYNVYSCIWRDLIKPSLWFSFFYVFCVSTGELLDFLFCLFSLQLELVPYGSCYISSVLHYRVLFSSSVSFENCAHTRISENLYKGHWST